MGQHLKDRQPEYESMIRAQQNNTLARLRKKETRLRLQIDNLTSDNEPDNQLDKLDKLEEELSEVK